MGRDVARAAGTGSHLAYAHTHTHKHPPNAHTHNRTHAHTHAHTCARTRTLIPHTHPHVCIHTLFAPPQRLAFSQLASETLEDRPAVVRWRGRKTNPVFWADAPLYIRIRRSWIVGLFLEGCNQMMKPLRHPEAHRRVSWTRTGDPPPPQPMYHCLAQPIQPTPDHSTPYLDGGRCVNLTEALPALGLTSDVKLTDAPIAKGGGHKLNWDEYCRARFQLHLDGYRRATDFGTTHYGTTRYGTTFTMAPLLL